MFVKNRGEDRVRKVNGKVIREYIGGGVAGRLAAQMDEDQRAERLAATTARQAERAEIEAGERALYRLVATSKIMASVALLRAGYRQHNRGEWRRKRE